MNFQNTFSLSQREGLKTSQCPMGVGVGRGRGKNALGHALPDSRSPGLSTGHVPANECAGMKMDVDMAPAHQELLYSASRQGDLMEPQREGH